MSANIWSNQAPERQCCSSSTLYSTRSTNTMLVDSSLRLESQSYGSSVTVYFRDPGHLWFMMFLIPPGLRNLQQTQSRKKIAKSLPGSPPRSYTIYIEQLTISVPQNLCMSTSKSLQESCVMLNPRTKKSINVVFPAVMNYPAGLMGKR